MTKIIQDLSKETFICTHCGQEYKYNPLAWRRYQDLDTDVFYMICPKDGCLAVPKGGLINQGDSMPTIVGEAIVGQSLVG